MEGSLRAEDRRDACRRQAQAADGPEEPYLHQKRCSSMSDHDDEQSEPPLPGNAHNLREEGASQQLRKCTHAHTQSEGRAGVTTAQNTHTHTNFHLNG